MCVRVCVDREEVQAPWHEDNLQIEGDPQGSLGASKRPPTRRRRSRVPGTMRWVQECLHWRNRRTLEKRKSEQKGVVKRHDIKNGMDQLAQDGLASSNSQACGDQPRALKRENNWSPAIPSATGTLQSWLRKNTEPCTTPTSLNPHPPPPTGILNPFYVIHQPLSYFPLTPPPPFMSHIIYVLSHSPTLETIFLYSCESYTSWKRSTDRNVLDIDCQWIPAAAVSLNNCPLINIYAAMNLYQIILCVWDNTCYPVSILFHWLNKQKAQVPLWSRAVRIYHITELISVLSLHCQCLIRQSDMGKLLSVKCSTVCPITQSPRFLLLTREFERALS